MKFEEVKNPRYIEDGRIEVDVLLPGEGEFVSFLASPSDCVAHGRELFEKLEEGDYGPIAEYVPDSDEVAYEKALAECLENRRLAYAAESDPLRWEYEYEEIIGTEESLSLAKGAWIIKVQEIKSRFPKPEKIGE